MKSTFDIVDILYGVLSNGAIAGVTGGVYKHKRPLNSNLIDIVINSLPVNNETVQQTVVNVNIHVPNLSIATANNTDNWQPDNKKLKSITALVITKTDEKNFGDYEFDVQQQNFFSDDEINEHYSNIRLNFYAENIKN